MKSVLFLLLSLCGYQAGGVHLLHTSGATTGSTNTTTLPVALVMFDHTYMKLFDCFLRYWAKQINSKERENKLDVVVYDSVAYKRVTELVRTYPPGCVRNIQLREISELARRRLSRGASPHARSSWSSMAYQAYFWQAILERLEMGEDVLHMDLDAIVVGDAWAPIASGDPSADLVGPQNAGGSFAAGQQYFLYRSTGATKELVSHFASIWEEWLSGASALPRGRAPLPAEQPALGEYILRYNPDYCERNHSRIHRECTTHTGGTFKWHLQSPGLVQNGACKFPEECREKGVHICHSRSIIQLYCAPEEVYGAKHHP